MSNSPVVIFVTKYALTSGILTYKVQLSDIWQDSKMVSIRHPNYCVSYFHGDDWHVSSEAAITRAEDMRRRKLASLQKQIDKLNKLVF